MSSPRVCTKAEIDKNAQIAQRTGTQFGPVTITVTATREVSPGHWEISFAIYGDPNIYTANWGDETQMWAPCPSDIPCSATPDNPGPPPAVRDSGKLYLSRAFIDAHRLSARPKWPTDLAGLHQPTKPLEIFPCSVEITGYDMASGQFVKATVELTNHELAGVNQKVVLDGKSPVTVELTAAGFAKFGRPF